MEEFFPETPTSMEDLRLAGRTVVVDVEEEEVVWREELSFRGLTKEPRRFPGMLVSVSSAPGMWSWMATS